MAAGAFSSVAQKRAHELAATRAASLDHGACAKVSPLAPNSQSQEAIAQAAVTTLINAKTRTTPPLKYFRPANSEICFGKMRFVLTDRPTNRNIDAYIGVRSLRSLARNLQQRQSRAFAGARALSHLEFGSRLRANVRQDAAHDARH